MADPGDGEKSRREDAATDAREEAPTERLAPEGPAAEEEPDGLDATLDELELGAAPDVGAGPAADEAPEATAPRPTPAEAPRPPEQEPSGVRARVAAFGALVRGHLVTSVLLAVIAVAAAAFLALALSHATAVPDQTTIEADARERMAAPAYSGGTYGADDVVVTRGVEVRSVSRSATAPEGSEARFGASGYAEAEVVVTYGGSTVSASLGATLAYAQVDGTWEGISGSDATTGALAWHATTGVDQQKVLRNVRLVLRRADELTGSADGGADGSGDGAAQGVSLEEIYADSDVTIESESFDEDAQTDTLEITCSRTGAFESYVCRMTVTFSFGQSSGRWEISSVEVADGARERSFEPIMGSWQGAFQRQDTDGTKCLAGRSAGLTITLDSSSTTDGVTRLSGTLSGLAHYHARPDDDTDSCDGDTPLEAVPFQATLVGGHNDATGSDLTFVATLPEDVGGTVTLTLGFGTEDDPGAVVALVQTTYPHTGSILFIPYEETLTYTDVFSLTRAE
ncbi:hypothetical protein [Olsenella profusa]|uniref:Uncharacterized protein n=1 Tax=Olsenella profusa TaxID=138595 RepID=A0ABS2F1I3_9ACTN|nr:hypothetical protein [Olsenella profusa]MBM6774688.1 hypothetical protein [Olsenella profusa]